jgi:hypothetical protein
MGIASAALDIKKKKGFFTSPEFIAGAADTAVDTGSDLMKYFLDRKNKLSQQQFDNSIASRQMNLEEQTARTSADAANKARGLNSLQFMANQRAAAVPASRARYRDILIYGG